MGWWSQDDSGFSFTGDGETVWGDGPADTIDLALEEIRREYETAWGRPPTKQEIISGLRFSLRCRDDFPGEI